MNLAISKELFYDWAGANVWIFKQINSLSGGGGFYDQSMQLISKLADGKHVFPYYLIALAIIAVGSSVLGIIKKRTGNRYIFNHWLAVIILFAVAFPVNAAINHYIKDYFAYPRPYVAIESGEVHKLEVRDDDDSHRSFPSGHIAFITCLVACLWSKLSETARPLGALAIVLVGWSRIALGMHFPADIVGSFFITLIVVALVRLVVFTILAKGLRLKW